MTNIYACFRFLHSKIIFGLFFLFFISTVNAQWYGDGVAAHCSWYYQDKGTITPSGCSSQSTPVYSYNISPNSYFIKETFAATAGTTYTFTLTTSINQCQVAPAGNCEIQILNYDCDGGSSGTPAVKDVCGVSPLTVTWTCGSSGTYYLSLSDCCNGELFGANGTENVQLTYGSNGSATAPSTCAGNVSPANNSTCIATNQTLNWSAVPCVTGYLLYFGTDAAATNIQNGLNVGNVTTWNPGPLTNCTKYYWKIVPFNGAGNSTCPPVIWNFTVSTPPTAATSITANPNPVCAGTQVTLTENGGNAQCGNWQWYAGGCGTGGSIGSGTSIVVTPTITTTYYVRAEACSNSACKSITVTVNSLPVANAGGNKTICSGQSTNLNGSGGGTYLWNPGGQTTASISVSPTTPTTYTLSVTTGCGTATDVATVNVNALPTANAGGNQTICSGGSATLNGSGGGTYNWSPSTNLSCTACANPVATPASNASYTVTVTNGAGCTASDVANITITSGPAANAGPNQTICSGQTATLTASGGGTYSWNTGSTSVSITDSPTTNTTYTVFVSNGSCSGTATASVNVNSLPAAAISGATTVCSGTSTTLSATGGGTYLWSNGATSATITVSPTANATYTVTVSNGSCSNTATASVNISSSPSATISGNNNICTGDIATLTASGGGTYVWNTSATTASISVSPTTNSFYTVTVTNPSGCTTTATVAVNVSSAPTASVSGNNTICAGTSTTLNASGGGNYSWSNGATTSSINISPASSGNYSVVVSFGTCADTASISVTVNPLPNANITGNNNICSGTSTTLSATGGGTYSWNNGSTGNSISVSPTATTSYSVTVTNASNCTATAVSSVTVTQPPVANATNATICSGNAAVLSATGGGTYSWNTNATTNSISVSPTVNSNYTVVVSNGNCKDTAYASIIVKPSPTAGTGADVSITSGNSTTLTASGGGNYSWNSGQTSQTISVSPSTTTDYCVYVTNASACVDSSCVRVYVELDCGEFFIPTAFSPNDDKKNDMFYVRDKCIKTMHLVIYDRWGNKVFETDDIKQGWDGSGTKSFDTAVFAYILNYELLNGEAGTKKGNITLVR